MENKNVLTISDLTAAILNEKMTMEDATNMFEKQLNASINAAIEKKAAENAKKAQEENINKSAVKVVKAVFDFIVTAYPDLIPNDFIFTDEMTNEAANELKDFTKKIIDILPAKIFKEVKFISDEKAKATPTEPFLIPEVDSLDKLLDELAKAGLLKIKPTCKYENLKKYNNVKKEDNISKFLREIGL